MIKKEYFRSIIKLKDSGEEYLVECATTSFNHINDQADFKCFSIKDKQLMKTVKKTDIEDINIYTQ